MICFDFDGVIADSHDLWVATCRTALAELGVDLPSDARPFARLRPLTFEQLARDMGIDARAFAARMAELALAAPRLPPLVPGMAQLLRECAELAPLALLSSSRQPFLVASLCHHGLSGLFSIVAGGGTGQSKAETLASWPSARIMIGDAASDIDAARAAGVASIGVTWGWQAADVMSHADIVVDSPEDLAVAIRSHLSSAS